VPPGSAQQDQAEARRASVPAQQAGPEAQGRDTEPRLAEGRQGAEVEAETTPQVTGPLAGDPLSLGLPSFIVGSVALGMVLIGFVSPLGTGASLPIILAATAIGLLVSTVWAMALGQSAVALILGVFAGFWLSYAFLLLGLTNGWFGIGLVDLKSTLELFLTAWVVIMSMLTLATLRLPVAYTAVLATVRLFLISWLIAIVMLTLATLRLPVAFTALFALVDPRCSCCCSPGRRRRRWACPRAAC